MTDQKGSWRIREKATTGQRMPDTKTMPARVSQLESKFTLSVNFIQHYEKACIPWPSSRTKKKRATARIKRKLLIPDYRKIKRNLYDRQKGYCFYCNRKIRFYGSHIDHIHPRCKGGEDKVENLCLSCPRCNSYKGGFSLSGWLYKLCAVRRYKGKNRYRHWKKWNDQSRLRAINKVSNMIGDKDQAPSVKSQYKKKEILPTWKYKKSMLKSK